MEVGLLRKVQKKNTDVKRYKMLEGKSGEAENSSLVTLASEGSSGVLQGEVSMLMLSLVAC